MHFFKRFRDATCAVLMATLLGCGGGGSATDSATTVGDKPAPTVAGKTQGLWVWNTTLVLATASTQQDLLTKAKAAGITDIYLNADAGVFATQSTQLQAFNTLLRANQINVWGLDGCRCYFSDLQGPAALYNSIDVLIAFNARVPAQARFVGFMADQEPQDDLQKYPTGGSFHNDLTDSQLSATSGGVWKTSQRADREALMQDFVGFFATANAKLKAAGLRTAGAMVFWLDDYNGEPIRVDYAGVRKPVSQHLMRYIDDYVMMTYNVDPTNAANRARLALSYASSLPASSRPRVSASMETHTLGGPNTVSYADAPGKNSKAVVLQDRQTINTLLASYAAFAGVSLHDLEGWSAMPN
jgi:hypothetical protein